jgi:hypothetical protein
MSPKVPFDLPRYLQALSEGHLLEVIEEDMHAEGLLTPEPPEDLVDLPPRSVNLGPRHVATFECADQRLWVYKSTAEPQWLPYFDPEGFTEDELIRKVKLLLTFS